MILLIALEIVAEIRLRKEMRSLPNEKSSLTSVGSSFTGSSLIVNKKVGGGHVSAGVVSSYISACVCGEEDL